MRAERKKRAGEKVCTEERQRRGRKLFGSAECTGEATPAELPADREALRSSSVQRFRLIYAKRSQNVKN